MRFVPLTPELLGMALIVCGTDFARAAAAAPGNVERIVGGSNAAEAMLDGGEIIGAGGVALHWHGRAEAWLVFAPDAAVAARRLAMKRCRRALDRLQADPAYRRVEMWVAEQAPWAESLGPFMGFERECRARAWGPDGTDYLLFSRIRDR